MITEYITQSSDTNIEAELIQFRLWREMSPSQKLNLFKRVYQKGCKLGLMTINHQFTHLSFAEIKQFYLRNRWQKITNNLTNIMDIKGELMLEDPLWLINQLTVIFEQLNIPYFVGGSVASSLQGEVRFTEDLDLVIDIKFEQKSLLINALSKEFYISDVAVSEAINNQTTSFNIIHLQTVEKADIFISGNDEFSMSRMSRRQLYKTEENQQSFYVSSAEDTILQKLLWFKMSKDQSQKQWRDILGVLKLQRERLDFAYLTLWSKNLGVKNNLEKAMTESGLSGVKLRLID